MTLLIEEDVEPDFPFDYRKTAEDVIKEALKHENFPYEAEVSLTITSPEEIRRLNSQFRQIDRETDVLSFPMIDYPAAGDFSELNDDMDIFNPETGEAVLGDIVLSLSRIKEQAKEYGHSVRREYAFLIAHSMLHLMGYDHMEDSERIEMEKRQNEILEALHITRDDDSASDGN